MITIHPQILSSIIIAVLIAALWWYVSRPKTTVHSLEHIVHPHSTPFLNSFATDFTALAVERKLDPVIARDTETRRLTQILSRKEKNNALLIGEAGVGKTALVEGLAVKIVSKAVPEELYNKRVLSLDVAGLISGTKYRGEFEERAKKIIQEITNSHRTIILFVDEIHSILEAVGTEGSLNLSDILKPALARGDLQMIGATTRAEYEKYFKTDPSFDRRFQAIEVHEPTRDETLVILEGVKDKYRQYHKVEFTDAALRTAVALCDTRIKDRKFPDKAIDALDEAAAMVKVGYLHPALGTVLYAVALQSHPEAAVLWRTIQDTDAHVTTASPEERDMYVKEREIAETALNQLGVVIVDSSDVEKIVSEWLA